MTLLEAARTLGGRARKVEHDFGLLDNGQHILLGAYTESLRLMRMVGVDPATALLRLPLQMRYPNGQGMDFVAARLPAPLHLLSALLRAKGLTVEDKLSLARFNSTARWIDWQLNDDCSVAELLVRYDQTDTLIDLLWRPLCIAALNTPIARASAQVFLNVLRDSLGAKRAASDMLIPRCNLSALFPEAAAQFIQANGSSVQTGTSVRTLEKDGNVWRSDAMPEVTFDTIVVATSAPVAATLLAPHMPVEALTELTYEPITTCYLQYSPSLQLDRPFYALRDDPEQGQHGQFVFDRSRQDPALAGQLAVVISTSSNATENGRDALVPAIIDQLQAAFPHLALHIPKWHKVITEKRATFCCTPALQRPANVTPYENLFIAGDYTASDYPATIESAARSGVMAARALIQTTNQAR